jgi:hypothetical protein
VDFSVKINKIILTYIGIKRATYKYYNRSKGLLSSGVSLTESYIVYNVAVDYY